MQTEEHANNNWLLSPLDDAANLDETQTEWSEEIAFVADNEIMYLADLLNSNMMLSEAVTVRADYPFIRNTLGFGILDGDTYEGLGGKWGVDANALALKVTNMSLIQLRAMLIHIADGWNRVVAEEAGPNFNDFLKSQKFPVVHSPMGYDKLSAEVAALAA